MRPSLALFIVASVAAVSSLTARAQFHIQGYDTPSYIQFSNPTFEVDGDQTNAVITLVRTGDYRKNASVDYATQDGTAEGNVHFKPCGGTVNFAAGQSIRTITIPILREQPAPPKTFQVELVQTSDTSLVITPTAQVEIKSLPTLSILAASAAGVQLAWPDVGAAYVLEAKADGDWQAVASAPTLVDGEWTIALDANTPMEWFRLRLNAQ
jgi:hypothetical protein